MLKLPNKAQDHETHEANFAMNREGKIQRCSLRFEWHLEGFMTIPGLTKVHHLHFLEINLIKVERCQKHR
jgi:hypothetical protein